MFRRVKPIQAAEVSAPSFAQALKEVREWANLTTEQLAEVSDVDPLSIRAMERGERQPTLAELANFACALIPPKNRRDLFYRAAG